MLPQRLIEFLVGIFVIFALGCLIVLAFQVSGLTSFFNEKYYTVTAEFDEIGQLKIRSAVTVSGVSIGEVSAIRFDPATYKAIVTMHINRSANNIPDDSTATIQTAGLLGDNYIAVTPMYSQTFWKEGSVIQETHPAMILEKLVGQMIYKLSNPTNNNSNNNALTSNSSDSNSSKNSVNKPTDHITKEIKQ